jgi:hypothetical protein
LGNLRRVSSERPECCDQEGAAATPGAAGKAVEVTLLSVVVLLGTLMLAGFLLVPAMGLTTETYQERRSRRRKPLRAARDLSRSLRAGPKDKRD